MVKGAFRQLSATQSLLGVVVALALLALYLNSAGQLLLHAGHSDWRGLFASAYFWHILQFSLFQALLSTALSVVFGIICAHALHYQHFVGKTLLLKLCSLTFVLPTLVAVFGLLGVYGLSGWLNRTLAFFDFEALSIYGLAGILLAHVFFNLPLATKLFYSALQSIPAEHYKLAAQLNLRGLNLFNTLELPFLKKQLMPTATLIFMLCFTSFAIVLTLGGGPKYTTLEVAIYQALTFDFDLARAAQLAIVQLLICTALFRLSHRFSAHATSSDGHSRGFLPATSRALRWVHYTALCLLALFVALPLGNIIAQGLSAFGILSEGTLADLWLAARYSLALALCAGTLCVALSLALLLCARQWHFYGFKASARELINLGMAILALPMLVIATGLYLALRELDGNGWLFGVVALCNALVAMPFALRILQPTLFDNMQRYQRLCQSLGIRGLRRFTLVEWATLKQPLRSALAYACALSLGDFTAIALFGSQDFTSLPRLLYQQLGHYRTGDGALTALVLLLLCAALFLVIEKYDKTQ
ncbi:thiamine/thiamine pyrophosphate ABC transporter permease [Pasteurellaceae bacterium TAE3-ERU1]|nr:thiamine/thiamine pyrophosphate ABC transporter permease [Pasteurellaceae bacterium TAE3-ERU1]